MLLWNKEASVTLKKNCCVKLEPQALGVEFSSVQMLIFFLLLQPSCFISSRIPHSLRKTLVLLCHLRESWSAGAALAPEFILLLSVP